MQDMNSHRSRIDCTRATPKRCAQLEASPALLELNHPLFACRFLLGVVAARKDR